MQAMNVEIIREEENEEYLNVVAKVRIANKLMTILDYYHLTAEIMGNGRWLHTSGDERAVMFRIPVDKDIKEFISRLIENDTDQRFFAEFD